MTTKHKPATPLRMRAAKALDLSLDAASNKVGIRTDKVRATLASYLDGQISLNPSLVRKLCAYAEMVSR